MATRKKPGRKPGRKPAQKIEAPVEDAPTETVEAEAPATELRPSQMVRTMTNIENAIGALTHATCQQIEMSAKLLQFFELLLIQSAEIMKKETFVENKTVKPTGNGAPPPKVGLENVDSMFSELIKMCGKPKAIALLREFTDGTTKDLKKEDYATVIRIGKELIINAPSGDAK